MNNFREKLKVRDLNDREARQTYEKFVLEQEEQFILFINYLNQYINELKEKGIISKSFKFYARVKATNSALKNYNQKALDDVFGIECICATEREISILQQLLERLVKTHKIKPHNKENGYKAIHHFCSIRKEVINRLNEILVEQKKKEKNEEKFPAVEIQYKTEEVYRKAISGTASHEKYKDTKLPQIQALYDANILTVGEYIPYMWVSNPDEDDVIEMTTEEVLRKMYPSLKIREKEEQEKETTQSEECEIGR